MPSSVHEFMEKLEEETDTFKFKFVERPWYRTKDFFIYIVRTPWRIKMFYQRAARGFSDSDCYSADYYLAGQIAGIMQYLVDNGHGVPMSYSDEDYTYHPDVDKMVKRRDADYAKHIAVFKEYANNGPAFNEDWQKEFGGVLDDEIKESLIWLSEHFSELWD
jgi:hypothetical protein